MEMETKDEMLAEERNLCRDLSDQVHTKTEEIKMLIERMETYRRHKEGEISKLVKQNR